MAINVSVQYIGGLLRDIILLTQCYYHRGTRLNAMKVSIIIPHYYWWYSTTTKGELLVEYNNSTLLLVVQYYNKRRIIS